VKGAPPKGARYSLPDTVALLALRELTGMGFKRRELRGFIDSIRSGDPTRMEHAVVVCHKDSTGLFRQTAHADVKVPIPAQMLVEVGGGLAEHLPPEVTDLLGLLDLLENRGREVYRTTARDLAITITAELYEKHRAKGDPYLVEALEAMQLRCAEHMN
jgi:hypothetical protein